MRRGAAKTIAKALTARRPHIRYTTDGGARTALPIRRVLFDGMLWRLSQSFAAGERPGVTTPVPHRRAAR